MSNEMVRRLNGEIQAPQQALSASAGFGTEAMQLRGETASQAIAAREQAAIQARYIVAMKNPRDVETFRVALLSHARRSGFAATAVYRKPVGKVNGKQTFAEGPSIRFAEAALQCYRNVFPEVSTVFDSQDMRIVRVAVTDLEANITYATEITIEKTVERKNAAGREILSQRQNSYDETTYTVRATDDELMVRQAALVSKALRTQALRLMPPDILEEAVATVKDTLSQQDKQDPLAAKRKLIDAFAEQGVTPVDLAAFIGHSLEQLTVKEIGELRTAYTALKTGESSWAEIMEASDTTPDPALAQETRARIIAEADAKKAAATRTAAPPVEQHSNTAPAEAAGEMTEEEHRRLNALDAAAEHQDLTSKPKGFRR